MVKGHHLLVWFIWSYKCIISAGKLDLELPVQPKMQAEVAAFLFGSILGGKSHTFMIIPIINTHLNVNKLQVFYPLPDLKHVGHNLMKPWSL